MRRVVFVVLDGVGVGALPDAEDYGDAGSDTLGNLCRFVDLRLPLLRQLGIGNMAALRGIGPVDDPLCLIGRLAPESLGKDTTVGHWEHMGLVTEKAFPTYPEGFPPDIIEAFSASIGRGVLGNKAASGTLIIEELGSEHLSSGEPIVYTSADSVFQIAAHVEVVKLEQLYEWCRQARRLLQGRHGVARVIARPFTGSPGSFVRTADRRDFSLPPPGPTYLDILADAAVPVMALGKVSEIFTGRGITRSIKTGGNSENLALLRDLVRGGRCCERFDEGLLVTNLGDFDTVWGHRNDASGFAAGLRAVDDALGGVISWLAPEDRLLVTADHGVDPTTASTDHSREYVPLLLFPRPPTAPQAVYEGALADTGAFVFEYLTGRKADLEGRALSKLQPARGWRRYTPVQGSSAGTVAQVPGRVGAAEAAAAARWLRQHLGPAPFAAIVLGSGLTLTSQPTPKHLVPYDTVPHWRAGTVVGHRHALAVTSIECRRWALLQGRLHEYEGFDLSETQLPLRSLAQWGVRRVILTTAAGAVDEALRARDLVVARTVLDFQHLGVDGRPEVLEGTTLDWAGRVVDKAGSVAEAPLGAHACVPGPQYETPAELEMLRRMGAATVSMSTAAEVRVAREEGQEVFVLVVVANCGDTSHSEVLGAIARASARVWDFVSAVAVASG